MRKPKDASPQSATGPSAVTEAMMAVNPVAAEAWLTVMSESARFLTDRLRQDMDTQKAMIACKSPVELLQVQADFLRQAMDDYVDYLTRLQKTMTGAATTAVAEVQTGHARGYDDVPV